MSKLLNLTFCIVVTASWALGAVSFLDPPFDTLSHETISSRHSQLTSLSSRSDAEQVELLVVDLFLIESLEYRGEIHAARELLENLLERCEGFGQSRFTVFKENAVQAMAAQTCAIAEAEATQRATSFGQVGSAKRALEYYNESLLHSPTQLDGLYTEGRVFFSLPPMVGQAIGKSLIAFRMLERLKPELESPLFWSGRIYDLQGNSDQADDYFTKAKQKGSRAQRFLAKDEVRSRREAIDGIGFGLVPSLYYSPTGGAGIIVQATDDRMWDTDRAIGLIGFASTRGFAGVELSYKEREWLGDPVIQLEASLHRSGDDFFGLGSSAPLTGGVFYHYTGSEVRVSAIQNFWKYFSFEAGLEYRGFSTSEAGFGPNLKTIGPVAQLTYDSRNSIYSTDSGTKVFLLGRFPSEVLGSDSVFEHWELGADHYFRFSSRLRFALKGRFLSVGTAVPLPWYPSISGSLNYPAARTGRFRDRNVLSALGEIQWGLGKSVRVLGLAGGGMASSQLKDVLKAKFQPYFAGGAQWQLGALKGSSVRLVLGSFGEEWLLQGNVSQSF